MRASMMNLQRISVNARAAALIERLRSDAAELRVAIDKGEVGELLIDAGSRCQGSIAAGLRLAEICMGGLGTVEIAASAATPNWPWTLMVRSSHPVTACLASQYAGWKLSHGSGKDAFFALGSGPARALARKEPLFTEIAYRDEAETAALVLESSRPPPAAIVRKVAQDCGISPERLNFLYAPTQSLAGSVQVVARVLEVALHKTHELKFPLDRIVEGMGAAPLSPPHPDFVVAMGRTNDAIIYGGRVHLFVNGPAGEARDLAERLPSRRSRDYGRPFAEIFASFNRDFYAIDPMLFAPAAVIVTALETGESFHAGGLEPKLLDAAFQ
jgi:methenyltetrahydromethanopterin cyclohydrolase